MRTDVAIIGGGIMGSALAYWLGELDPTLAVTVIERDPSYARASSALSAASIRQQFTTEVNVRISQHSVAFLREASARLATGARAPDIGLTERGYLYLAGADELPALGAANALQRKAGVDVALLTPAALATRFPWLEVGDLAAGSLGASGEGWFDGFALLTAFAAKARSLGARYLRGEVVGMSIDRHRVGALALADGTRLECGYAVNAAGPWAAAVAALARIALPVAPRRRTVFVVSCPTPLPGMPLIVDRSGFWLRPERGMYIGAPLPADDPDGAPLEPELARFESEFWPLLAHRIPAFESARLERAWAGYYEYNTVDQNGILGFHPALDNLVFMNGFSGHGMQQAPIVGRGIAELLLTGRYVTVDLEPLDIARLVARRPLRELNVIG